MTIGSTRRPSETPFGVRLKAARKMAGMSMEDLAQKVGGIISKQAIGKYEKGQMMPTAEVLERLVEVLRIATWGASPLRPDDRETAIRWAQSDPRPPISLDEGRQPLLRKRGVVGRLKKGHGPAGVEIEKVGSRPIDEKRYLSFHPSERSEAGSSRAEQSPFLSDLASLAARRSRHIRAWESDAGMNRIRFREGGRLSAKTGLALKYLIADHLQRYLELESILGARSGFTNPLTNRTIRSKDEVETAAAEVRNRWDLGAGPIVNLLGLIEDWGVKVYETRGIGDFDGLSGRLVDVPFVAVSLSLPADRVRFTAARELGHIMCGFSINESPEGMCHAFGAALLLPRAALDEIFTPSRRKVTLGELGEIKETFGISLQAIMRRAHDLGLVSARQLRAFREMLKARGWSVEEPVAYAGKERATRFRRLIHRAVAAGILEVERAAEMARMPSDELEKEIGEIF